MRSIGYLLIEGVRSLWKNRTMSIASIAVLFSCLMLTGIAGLVSINMETIMKSVEETNSIKVYLYEETPQLEVISIGETIRSLDNISSCIFVPKEDGLAYMMESLDADVDLFEGLDDFLPDSYTISMADLTLYEETISQITAIEGVEEVNDYSDIAEKLISLDSLITYGSMAVIIILGIVSLFIISNTVKVTMFTRRVEISIMKSVGATNLFIRIPFVVEGLLIGLFSGGISATVLYFSYDKATEIIYNIVPFISIFDIEPYSLYIFAAFALLGSLFGIMGGIISLSRYLKKEGEEAII